MKFIPRRKKAPDWFVEGWEHMLKYRDEEAKLLKYPSKDWLTNKLTTPQQRMERINQLNKIEQYKVQTLFVLDATLREYLFNLFRLKTMDEDINFATRESLHYDYKTQLISTKLSPLELINSALKRAFKGRESELDDIKIFKQ